MDGQELQEYRKPLTAVEVKAQVQLIQEVMAAVMVKDVHYGIIPGTNKPTLYKPGSEKILSTFRIAAYPRDVEDLSTFDEIRYRVKVHGVAMENDQVLFGVGIGECSSSEDKYRWRKPVCDAEFDETPEDRKRVAWKKKQGGAYQQKQVRTNPSDVANTILKMAKKRAQIDMTLTATGASDVFDQDLEDLPDGILPEGPKGEDPKKTTVGRKSERQGKTTEPSGNTPHESLTAELDAYCGGDTALRADVLKEISLFVNDKGEEVFMRNIPSEGKNEKWVESSLGKLRKLVQAGTGGAQGAQEAPTAPEGWKDPAGCQHKPTECDHSGWIDGKPYCGPDGPICPYFVEDEG